MCLVWVAIQERVTGGVGTSCRLLSRMVCFITLRAHVITCALSSGFEWLQVDRAATPSVNVRVDLRKDGFHLRFPFFGQAVEGLRVRVVGDMDVLGDADGHGNLRYLMRIALGEEVANFVTETHRRAATRQSGGCRQLT